MSSDFAPNILAMARISSEVFHRQVRIDERPTSLALEAEFWQYIREIAFERKVTQGQLISVVNRWCPTLPDVDSYQTAYPGRHF
jgi:predicted DNA-binding ribbon-helix-helix protein